MAFEEITYTKKFDDGKTRERVATSPRDKVQLEFDGWTPKADKATTASTSSHSTDHSKSGK